MKKSKFKINLTEDLAEEFLSYSTDEVIIETLSDLLISYLLKTKHRFFLEMEK